MGDVEAADELIDVVVDVLDVPEPVAANDKLDDNVESLFNATNCTKSCNWFTCCVCLPENIEKKREK